MFHENVCGMVTSTCCNESMEWVDDDGIDNTLILVI